MTQTAFQTQSAKDDALDQAIREARGEFVDKKKWFDVADSLFEDDDGNEYYNVQAKFSDHAILNIEKSRAARKNVYEVGIVLHTKVMRQSDLTPAIKNSSSHVMRFDKGEDTRVMSYRAGPDGKDIIHYDGKTGMGKEAFDAAVRDIMRCWDAWEHYQKFRTAPIHPMEEAALEIIRFKPLEQIGTLETDDDEIDEEAELPPPVTTRKQRAKRVK